jgi:hypothetical protein
MTIRAVLPAEGRDLRLDLFRGIANWAIFLNHIPNITLVWITTRNYGFSDGAELFVFIAGYAAAIVYAKSMATQGFAAGTTRLLERAWQLYVAHVVLFVINIAVITWTAQNYNQSQLLDEFNVARFIDHPVLTLTQGLLLKYKPFNLDILPLYIALLAACPPVLWLMLRRPHVAIMGSLLLYFAARHFEWNLPAYPGGVWYFNPFTWQFLFLLGAWCALGGAPRMRTIIWSPIALLIGTAYLIFALLMTMAGHFETLGNLFPEWLVSVFNPNDKTNLAPYRIVHFIVIAVIVVQFMPIDWPGLKSKLLQPLIVCGQRSLEVFCAGLLLSFVAHFLLEEISASLLAEILVSTAGIGLMTGIAYYRSWSKKLDKRPRSPAPGYPSDEAISDVDKLVDAQIANRFKAADSRSRSPSVSGRTKQRTAKLTTN